ncbi:helix-turn-helix domain-containing protein [Flavonifractor plautii]|uniref:helix-turn-helix domain-containing protein n=1 Tax=Flavonifractor plautii TaxID=292800 RepID=UPI0019599740|nr:helix-turn-helix domain-containing protein [Flavonifractor plautii]MBM6665343.1 helix-turn-helix domain-containing protein [Flavonifractor plautii]
MSEILTVKEAAALLKTSRQQICRMIQNGELPAVKVGREWRISRNALLDYLGFPY